MRPRNVVVMLVLAVLAVLAWTLLEDDGGRRDALPSTLPAFVKDEVTQVVVAGGTRRVVLRRRTDRSDAWESEEGTSMVRADAATVDDLLSTLARQDVRAKFARTDLRPGDVKGYGLDDPSVTVELTTGPKTQVVRYGKRTREGAGVYVDSGPDTDVWVVGGNLTDLATSLITSGARSKQLTDVRLFDVAKVEIVRGGVTTFEAARDASQIWRTAQPFRGFADPTLFETWLGRLVSADVLSWAEIGAQDLGRYGLVTPRAEVRLTPRRGGEPFVFLVGADAVDGSGVLAMEAGRPNVVIVPKKVLDAVTADPLLVRDRSFSRLGIDGVAVNVRIGTVVYELRKEGMSWDVTRPERFPGDDDAIRSALEKVRSWQTAEWLDAAKPEEHGVTDASDAVEIELQSGGKVKFLLGAEGPGATRYAVRRAPDADSGVERVDASVVNLLARGYAQFRRRTVRDFATFLGDLTAIARDAGRGEDGAAVQTVVIKRDPEKSTGWELATDQGPGVVGTIDAASVTRIVSSLSAVSAREWLFWSPERNDEMGFHPPVADTLTLTITFSGKSGTPPGGTTQTLLVGKKREGGGYFAKFRDDPGWAFVLDADVVEALRVPVTREPPK